MTTEHTPGPWTFDTSGEGKPCSIITSVHDEHGPDDDVCEVYGGNTDCEKTRKANARLIAAAPELLEALMESRGAICAVLCAMRRDMPNHSWIPALNKAEERSIAAIAKATGEPVMAA
jgi:hypothetical protein